MLEAAQNSEGLRQSRSTLDNDQGASRPQMLLVLTRLFFRDAQSQERAEHTARGGPRGGTGKQARQDTPRQYRPDTRNQADGDRNPGQHTQRAARDSAGGSSFFRL